jgi:hypothetical protein
MSVGMESGVFVMFFDWVAAAMVTMQQAPGRQGFALKSALVWLTATALLAAGVSWLSLVLAAHEPGQVTLAVGTLLGLNGFCAILGVALVALLSGHSHTAATVIHMAAAVCRFLCNLLAVLMLILVADISVNMTLLALAFAYFPLLVVETWLVGRFMWQQGSHAHCATSRQSSADTPLMEALA